MTEEMKKSQTKGIDLDKTVPYTKNPLLEGFREGYFETSDYVKLHYIHKGNGMPLILLHGAMDNVDCWMLNAPAFAEHYSVYVYDHRGHGNSMANYGAHIHRLGADLHEFIEALGVDKVNLCVWSMGCAVVWSYIEIFGQDKINKVVFTDEPAALVANERYTEEDIKKTGATKVDFWKLINAIADDNGETAPIGTLTDEALISEFDNGVLFFDEEISKKIPDGYYEKMMQRPERPEMQYEFMSRLMRDHFMLDWSDIIPRISVKALLLTGDMSCFTTPEQGEWLSRTMQNCKWIRFSAEEYGIHDICQTVYRKYNRIVLEFLAEQD